MDLKKGQMANAEFHRCRQDRCDFFRIGGCRNCDDCKAKPYEIRSSCSRCVSCEGEEGELRWGDQQKMKLKDALKQKIRAEMMVKEGD